MTKNRGESDDFGTMERTFHSNFYENGKTKLILLIDIKMDTPRSFIDVASLVIPTPPDTQQAVLAAAAQAIAKAVFVRPSSN